LSHELRTPLNSILGYAQLMERQTDKTTLIENASRTIRRSGEHLAGLIEGLLDISKIEAGKIQISREKTAIISHFNQLVDMISPQATDKNLQFNFHCSDDFPAYVYADERRLRQVLINLLSNAVKFTKEGSVNFSASYRNQIATIIIEDTGPGIAHTNLERIFLPFERIENGTGDTPSGTGLGLTITKLLVEIMGGDLQVESKLGQGTTFTIRLMLSSVPEILRDQKPDLPVNGYHGPRLKISVADDDPLQRQLMKDTLSPLGFTIEEFSNGAECLNSLNEQQPDLLILDIGMPDMDGWQVMAKIRSQISANLPILVVSADAGIEQMNTDLQELNCGYLMKPVEISNLIHSIGLALNLTWKFENQKPPQKAFPHAN
jgi:CheY-like chemotaxis protein/anti-sigma regulatory factor (Ser/Thr protein kinase)